MNNAVLLSSRQRPRRWSTLRLARTVAPFSSLTVWLVLLCLPCLSLQAQRLGERSFAALSPAQLTSIISNPDASKNLNPSDPNSHLSKILIPRPVDTENNTLVRNFIVATLQALDWTVEEDSFSASTPYGTKQFTNVIATKDPDAPRRLIVAAHFDSKFFPTYPQNQFVGATDSAAPCAIMLDLAEALNPLLDRRKENLDAGLIEDEDVADTTLQLVFFDGEEAFKDWTATDSVYGARHLAETWSSTYIQPNAKRRFRPADTELSTIEHLVLLDLLGAPNPKIQSYFLDTAWLFDAMIASESQLTSVGAFDGFSNPTFFKARTGLERNSGMISDDHVPFMNLGVSVLHVIAYPFPRVWHTLKDDASALDVPTMRKWNLIMRVFLCEYLGLQPDEKASVVQRSNGELPRRSVEL